MSNKNALSKNYLLCLNKVMNYLWILVIIVVILFASQMKEGAASSPGALTQLATSSPYYWNNYLGGYNMYGPYGSYPNYGSYGYYPYHTFPMYSGARVTYIPSFKHRSRGWYRPMNRWFSNWW